MIAPLVSPPTLILFALATLILTASPGPGVLYISARSFGQGRRAGFASMFGIESGEVVWIVATVAGLSALLASYATALTFLRFAGASYLIFLGILQWHGSAASELPGPTPVGLIFLQGFLTQVLNPKVAVFFVAFLPQFLNSALPIASQVLELGIVYMSIALMVDTTYVMTAAAEPRRFVQRPVAQVWAGRFAAVTYIVLGLAAASLGAETNSPIGGWRVLTRSSRPS